MYNNFDSLFQNPDNLYTHYCYDDYIVDLVNENTREFLGFPDTTEPKDNNATKKIKQEPKKPSVPIDEGKGIASEAQKRKRRLATEINREYKCTVENCFKSYGNESSLKQHLKLKHKDYAQEEMKIIKQRKKDKKTVEKNDKIEIPTSSG